MNYEDRPPGLWAIFHPPRIVPKTGRLHGRFIGCVVSVEPPVLKAIYVVERMSNWHLGPPCWCGVGNYED